MRILIDTNILLDAIIGREPFFPAADAILKRCAEKKISGVMAAHSVPNMFFILRHTYSEEERRMILLNLCDILSVESINKKRIISALKQNDFNDFEDCLQSECAISAKVDYIITRNKADFAESPIPCLTAAEFLEKYPEK